VGASATSSLASSLDSFMATRLSLITLLAIIAFGC
jgi:hypothetical protein